ARRLAKLVSRQRLWASLPRSTATETSSLQQRGTVARSSPLAGFSTSSSSWSPSATVTRDAKASRRAAETHFDPITAAAEVRLAGGAAVVIAYPSPGPPWSSRLLPRRDGKARLEEVEHVRQRLVRIEPRAL